MFNDRPPSPPPSFNQSQQRPNSPPPRFIPAKSNISPFAIDAGAIRPCRFRFVYIWLTTGREFWFYPVFVGRTSIAGYRFTNFGWVYSGFDLNLIESFHCI